MLLLLKMSYFLFLNHFLFYEEYFEKKHLFTIFYSLFFSSIKYAADANPVY